MAIRHPGHPCSSQWRPLTPLSWIPSRFGLSLSLWGSWRKRFPIAWTTIFSPNPSRPLSTPPMPSLHIHRGAGDVPLLKAATFPTPTPRSRSLAKNDRASLSPVRHARAMDYRYDSKLQRNIAKGPNYRSYRQLNLHLVAD